MSYRRPTRRAVVQAAVALPLAASVPGLVLPGPRARDRRFLFLVAAGGWDPTLVFEPPRRGDGIDRPAGTQPAGSGALVWASASSRPSVDRFFTRWGDRAAVVNGLDVRCLGHEAARRRLLTGSAAPGRPDWPTLLAGSGKPVAARPLADGPFDRALRAAAERLHAGRGRCELLDVPGVWDTHQDNAPQSGQFETLFKGLDRLFDRLSRTAGQRASTRLDETIVVVLSELGRTPRLNATGGKDHWPITSALLAGAGVAGGRVVGATDGGLCGRRIDLRTGLPRRSGDPIGAENLGATLLALGGLEAERHLPGVPAIEALRA